jgi:hypothetical protein
MRIGTLLGGIFSLALGLQAAPTVLVWSEGNSGSSTAAVAAWIQSSGFFASVTGVDSGSTTLPLSTLLNYDEVLFFTNGGGDSVNTGNVLHNYALTGRRLVVATFSWANQGGNTLGGLFITNGDSPFILNGSSLYSAATMASNDGSAFFTGVNTISGYYRDKVQLTMGATQLATWSDGDPMEAIKGNVIGITLFPDDAYGQLGGDYRRLFVNALAVNAGTPLPGVPLPPTVYLSGLGILALGIYAMTRKQATA